MKEIEFKEELEKSENDTYLFTRVYKAELTKDECLKYKTSAEKNIEAINKLLAEHTEERLNFAIDELNKSVDLEAELKRQALDNFEKYQEETIADFKSKTEQQKKEFQDFLDNLDKIKEEVAKRAKAEAAREKENLLYQLKDEEQIVAVYSKMD